MAPSFREGSLLFFFFNFVTIILLSCFEEIIYIVLLTIMFIWWHRHIQTILATNLRSVMVTIWGLGRRTSNILLLTQDRMSLVSVYGLSPWLTITKPNLVPVSVNGHNHSQRNGRAVTASSWVCQGRSLLWHLVLSVLCREGCCFFRGATCCKRQCCLPFTTLSSTYSQWETRRSMRERRVKMPRSLYLL